MLDYTKMAIKQTVTDLKKVDYIRNVATQIIYILYLCYTLIAKTGVLAANVILLVLSVAYTVFFFTMTSLGNVSESEIIKKTGAKIYIWSKRLIKLFTLSLTIYGICTAVEKVTPVSVILAALMIVGWCLQIIFEVLIKVLTKRINLIVEGLEADLDNMLRPVRSVGNFFKKISGKEVPPKKEPTKNQLRLKEKVDAFRAEQARKKAEEKLRRETELAAAKQTEKDTKRQKKQSERLEQSLLRAAEKKQRIEEKLRAKQPRLPAPAPSSVPENTPENAPDPAQSTDQSTGQSATATEDYRFKDIKNGGFPEFPDSSSKSNKNSPDKADLLPDPNDFSEFDTPDEEGGYDLYDTDDLPDEIVDDEEEDTTDAAAGEENALSDGDRSPAPSKKKEGGFFKGLFKKK